MIRKIKHLFISFAVLLGVLIFWLPNSLSAEEVEYTLATDEDFSGESDGDFRYIGTDEYVEIPHVIKGVPVTSYSQMFEDTAVKGVKSTNPNVTDMSYMFYNSRSTSLDLSSFDTSNVVDMMGMFSYSSSLKEVDLSNFDTSKVTDMYGMFYYASSLKELDLSNFDTSNVTDMGSMFSYASSLTKLDLSGFDTSKVTDMYSMFSYASSLKDLDLSNFDTSNVTDMDSMFSYASSLTELDLSNFDTSNVTDMRYMFANASSLTELNLSNFDTSNVTNMRYMFAGASSLTELDLSNFDTSNVTDMRYMFANASSLKKLDLRKFETSQLSPRFLSGLFFETNLELVYAKSILDAERLAHPDTFDGDGSINIIPVHYPEITIDDYTDNYVNAIKIKPHITQFVLKGKGSNRDDDYTIQSLTSRSLFAKQSLTSRSLFAKGDEYVESDDVDITSYQYMLTENPTPDSSGWQNVDNSGTIIVEGMTGDYYLHVRVENEQGETASATSGVLKLDNTPPSIKLTPDTTDIVGKVNINIHAEDEHSGIEKVTLPDGTETNESEFTFPVTENGTYTFEAIDSVGNSTTESITVSNIGLPATPLEPAMTSVSVEKKWKGERQDKVVVNLLADRKKIDSVELSDDNDWKHIFTDLPTMYDIKDSKLIEYTVEEVEVSGYKTSITGSARDGFVITNTRTGEIEIPVEKKWKLYEKEAQAIEVKLLQNGVEVERVELSEDNNWRHVFSMPLYDEEGEMYTYTVEEIEVDGFESVVTGNQKDGYVITNTEIVKQIPLEPAMTSVSVEKKWKGERQDKVVVNLLADGKKIDSVELSDDNDWRYTFTDLPVKNDIKDGEEIEYTVSEEPIEGYEISIVEQSKNNFVITNTEVVKDTPKQPDEPDSNESSDEEDSNKQPDEPDSNKSSDEEDSNEQPDEPDSNKSSDEEEIKPEEIEEDEVEEVDEINKSDGEEKQGKVTEIKVESEPSEDSKEENVTISSKNDDKKNTGNLLPNTATNQYNLMLAGALLIFVGMVFFLYKKKS